MTCWLSPADWLDTMCAAADGLRRPYIPRGGEDALVSALALDPRRLVLLIGDAGSGTSRLAVELACRTARSYYPQPGACPDPTVAIAELAARLAGAPEQPRPLVVLDGPAPVELNRLARALLSSPLHPRLIVLVPTTAARARALLQAAGDYPAGSALVVSVSAHQTAAGTTPPGDGSGGSTSSARAEEPSHVDATSVAPAPEDATDGGEISRKMVRQLCIEGRFEEAASACAELIGREMDRGDFAGLLAARTLAGDIAAERGDREAALAFAEQALAGRRAIGELRGQILMLHRIAALRRLAGNLDAASAALIEALALETAVGNPRGVALCRHALGQLAESRGEAVTAADHYASALELLAPDDSPAIAALREALTRARAASSDGESPLELQPGGGTVGAGAGTRPPQ